MATIIVLLPNGRRHIVKVTPNTTILEIIDKACSSSGLPSENYSLKHHRKILDPTLTVRFLGLPQNAQLLLVEAKEARVESDVIIYLQQESGERFEGRFQPSSTLWEIIEQLSPEQTYLSIPGIVYMHREVSGQESLKATTLRNIGLYEGRAVLRLIKKTQATITSNEQPLPLLPIVEAPSILNAEAKTEPFPATCKNPDDDLQCGTMNLSTAILSAEKIKLNVESSRTDIVTAENLVEDTGCNVTADCIVFESAEINGVQGSLAKRPRMISPDKSHQPMSDPVILLGEREAIAYHLDSVPLTAAEDLPDDFYELSITDVKNLTDEARQRLKGLEDFVLTSGQRKLNADGLILRKLAQYKSCVIRIRFPDKNILQGFFKPIETVNDVYDFVKNYLEDPSLQFYLYVTPPKSILKREARLIEVGCVPNGIFQLGLCNTPASSTIFLKTAVHNRLSSYTAAHEAAKKIMAAGAAEKNKELPGSDSVTLNKENKLLQPPVITGSDKSNNTASAPRATTSSSQTPTRGKIFPKWLKLSK